MTDNAKAPDESATISTVSRAIQRLPEDAQQRVADYLHQRFGSKPKGAGTAGARAVPENEP